MSADYDSAKAKLLEQHAVARRQRDAAELGSKAHRAAVEEIGRIEVAIAELGRRQSPPRV